MSETTEVVNVYSRLAAARDQFHTMLSDGAIKKNGYNKFLDAFYFELGDIVPPALKCLHSNGLCATPMRCNGLEAVMSVVEIETGNEVTFTIPFGKTSLKNAHEIMNIGASLSYCRRYLWMNLMECAEQDIAESSEPVEKLKPTDPATEKQMNILREAYKKGTLPEAAADTLTKLVESGKKVTIEQASALIESLQFNPEKEK